MIAHLEVQGQLSLSHAYNWDWHYHGCIVNTESQTGYIDNFTHLPLDKMTAISQTIYIQMHFCE